MPARAYSVVTILVSVLVCSGCGKWDRAAAPPGPAPKTQEGVPLTLEQRLQAVALVFDSFADALGRIASKYPEMAGYQKDTARWRSEDAMGCGYSHNFTRPNYKRGIIPSDFRKHGISVSLSCKAMPPPDRAYAMTPPALRLHNLQLYVWNEIATAPDPSPRLVDEVNAILQSHLQKLEKIDGAASAQQKER